MATVEEILSLSRQLDQPKEQDISVVDSTPTFGDYIMDIVRAPVGGIGDVVQGLLTLGAIPIDYVADTNLTKNIEDLFEKWSPDAKTGIGEVVQTLVQFGLPLGVASKVGSGMKILKGANVRKLSDPSLTTLGKAGELARRAGYFGAVSGVLDAAVSNPGSQTTLSESLGLTESKNLDELEGRERAAEVLKQKLKFGAEGAVIGGAIPLLPAAGTIGYKYGLVPAAKVASPVLKTVLNNTDRFVLNPLSKAIAGQGSKSLASDIVKKGGDLLDIAYTKTGLPPVEKWKTFDAKTGDWSQRILKRLDNLKTQFTFAGKKQFPEIAEQNARVTAAIDAESKSLAKYQQRINNTLENMVTNYKVNVYDKVTKSGQFNNIMDRLTEEKNKVFDYLKATGPDAQAKALAAVDKSVRTEVQGLKNILKESNSKYYNLISGSKKEAHKELANAMVDQMDSFFKQRFAAFNNKSYQYDPITGPVGSKALAEVKKVALKNPTYRKAIEAKTREQVGTQGIFAPGYQKKYSEALEKNATEYGETLLKKIRDASIEAGVDPDYYVKSIATTLGKEVNLLKGGEEFPDAIKRYLSQPKGAKVPIKDYENALVDTIAYQAKQVYSKNYFDSVFDILKNKGALLTEEEKLLAPNKFTKLQPIQRGNIKIDDPFFTSKLFDGQHYTLPEIANALTETKVAFDNFFDLPGYKSMMSLKAGAQVAKTIFSPMTQIRNVTTASFFPLASGLIGGRTSLGDAWKLVAEDIFTGAKTNLEKLNLELDDMIRRGVIDQNIQVSEMRAILNRAKDGAITFESFMNNPTVKKFVDVYQGGDNLWKVYSDKFYQSALREAFGDPKATPDKVLENVRDWYKTVAKEDFVETSVFTGQAKSAEEALKEVSAYLVTNTMPTYSKVPDVIKTIRGLPIGNFVAFPSEIIRTSSNLLVMGARELTSTNPYIRQMGARRLIGASATFGGIGKVVSETAQALTGVDEDTMEAAKRSFIPVYEKNATLIPLSRPDSDGKFKYFNFSYSNPYDSLVRPMNAIISSFAEGTLNKDTLDKKILTSLFGDPVANRPGAITEFFSPFVTESIGTERVFDLIVRNGETKDGSKIFYPQDNIQTRIAKGIDHIFGGLTPGAYTQAKRVWEGATGQFTDAGTARSTKDELLALMSGIRVQEVKPLSSMPFILTSYNRDKQNIGSKFSREAYSANTSAEEKLSAWKDYVLESFDSQQKMYRTLRDAEDLGLGKRDLQRVLNERLTKSDTERLIRGRFKPPSYSEERFKSLINRLEVEDPAAAFRFESDIDIISGIFDDVRKELGNYDLDSGIGDLNSVIDNVLSPELPEVRNLPPLGTITSSGTTAQAPNLPSQISGTPVASNVLSNQQNLGQRFNLTAQLSPEEKTQFLFGNRIV